MRAVKYGAGIVILSMLAVAPAASAGPSKGKSTAARAKARVKADKHHEHNLESPMAKKQRALLERALQDKLRGKSNAKGKVAKMGTGKMGKPQYVELAREGTDRVFVILAEFGNARHTLYPDKNPDGTPASDALTFEGPLHNQIPKPNRAVDNSTLWQADYNNAHYENMYFNRMARYFEHQSSNRYSVAGDVNGWVKVPFNEARYGRDLCGSIVCSNVYFLIRDAMAMWVQGQTQMGKTNAEIAAYLKTFDIQDRYDMDGDGNFREPDGFIDHFQIVHAGGDQAAGDPQQGEDAIWSHRSYAAIQAGGPGGFPGVNIGSGGPSGGQQIPHNPVGVWVGDYTIQPENGGLGVFAHEYAHDLGLPDLYDTSGNTGGAENSTAFWSLMSSGANIGDGGVEGIGDDPVDLSAWEKFSLGWLGCGTCPGGRFYDVVNYGETARHLVGDNDTANTDGQALFALLPDKARLDKIGTPKSGEYMFFSGVGHDLNNTMTRAVSGGGTLTAAVSYDLEEHYDYAFLEASTNGGTTFTPVKNNLSDPTPGESGFNQSLAGWTGTSAGWVTLTATLPAGTTHVRFRYQTDPAVAGTGLLVDDVTLNGTVIGSAETANEGWVFAGFRRTTGTETSYHFNAYVAENRYYDDYDSSLRTAYNFGFLNTKPDWVETYPYQQGVLIWYRDQSFGDNNVGEHPGGGELLPIDAHPTPEHWSDGTLMRQRIQSYDSTFGKHKTQSITLHKDGVPTTIKSKPGVTVFDDTKTWWYAGDGHSAESHGRYQVGWTSVNVPKTGTTITVVKSNKHKSWLQVN